MITMMWIKHILGCICLMSYFGSGLGAPSPKGLTDVYEDPRHPGLPLSIPIKKRFDILNPKETSSGNKIVDGDIVRSSSGSSSRKFIPDPEYRWPEDENGWPTVPYIITDESAIGDGVLIKEGLALWMEHTCLIFTETTFTAMPHVRFIKDDGCYSNVGRQYMQDGQDISIGRGCESIDTVLHEVGHSIGFEHEQNRIDRDDYIKIHWENIEEEYTYAFDKVETNSTGIEYDYTSVMQYASNSFSSNGISTMIPLNPLYEPLMSTENGLTFRDKFLANRVYGCIDKWESQCGVDNPLHCNEGYLGSDCNCICPNGKSGDHCDKDDGPYYPPLSCGGNVTEPTDIQSPNYPESYNRDEWCLWWIQAEEGSKSRITFHDFDLLYRSEDFGYCYWDYLEIRYHHDPLESGRVFCEEEISVGHQFISHGRDLVIVFYGSEYAYYGHRGFNASIDFIDA